MRKSEPRPETELTPAPAPTPAETASRNLHVHGARGLFAFAVFVFHVLNSGLPPEFMMKLPASFPVQALQYGVELFFGISGIVIIAVYQKTVSYGDFILNRFTRIFPVLWVTIACDLVLILVGRDTFAHYSLLQLTGVVIANLIALPGMVYGLPIINPAAWSLSYEFAFYLVIMAFGLLNRQLKNVRFGQILTWIVIGSVSAWMIATHIRGIYFVSGILVALGVFNGPRWERIIRYPGLWMLVFLATWQYNAKPNDELVEFALGNHPAVPYLTTLTRCIGVAAGTFALAGIYHGKGIFRDFLLLPVMQWLGTISYSFYLWQAVIGPVVKHAMELLHIPAVIGPFSQLAFFVLALPPILVVSHYSQIYLETHAMKYLRKLIKRGKPNTPVSVPKA